MKEDKAKMRVDDMMKMKGKDFEKADMNMMLDGYKGHTKAFDKTAKECKDTDMKDFAATTLPVLMIHLE